MQILDGSTSLVDLDEKSLRLRGKQSKAAKASTSKKRGLPSDLEQTSSPAKKAKGNDSKQDDEDASQDAEELEAIIDSSDKTDFQKKCLKLLTQIPSGQFSTYGQSSLLKLCRRAVR
jgi:methylated-DNA-[protein]-cysteine S-methyltransferase